MADVGGHCLSLERMLPNDLKYQEKKRRRASEGEQSVNRRDRAEAPPGFRKHDITVTERRVRNPSEIPTVGERSQVARLPEKSSPHRGFRDVRHEKTGDSPDNDENIRRPRSESALCPIPEQHQDVGEAEEDSGMERRDKCR